MLILFGSAGFTLLARPAQFLRQPDSLFFTLHFEGKTLVGEALRFLFACSGFLGQAESALAAQKYDAAIGFYDEALKLDPASPRALSGRSTAIQARVLAQAGASAGNVRTSTTRAFVSSRTAAQSLETRTGNVPEGFEDSPGVNVKKGTQAADLPGRINFDIDPDTVKAGERYSVKVYLVNEGLAPIQIRDMLVTTKINGKGASGPVPPQTRDVAPGQRALLEAAARPFARLPGQRRYDRRQSQGRPDGRRAAKERRQSHPVHRKAVQGFGQEVRGG